MKNIINSYNLQLTELENICFRGKTSKEALGIYLVKMSKFEGFFLRFPKL